MGNKILITILASLSLISTAFADHHEDGDKKPFSIYGDFVGSVSFLGNENNVGGHDDFTFDLAEINIEKNWSKSMLHLSIGYGKTAATVNSVLVNPYSANVMNAYYKMMSDYGLSFTFGKFESPMGYETYNSMDNSLFTRSYGFSLTPYFSMGLGVNYAIGSMIDLGLIVSNGTGGQDTDLNDKNKAMTLTAGFTPMDNLAIDLAYLTTVESNGTDTYSMNIIDASVAFMINEMFDVALNYVGNTSENKVGTAGSKSANSIALYGNANLGMFGVGLRYEMVDYETGAMNPEGTQAIGSTGTKPENTINAISLAANAEIDQNATVILEYRTDSSDEKIWTDKDGNADDAQDTITLGLMYRF